MDRVVLRSVELLIGNGKPSFRALGVKNKISGAVLLKRYRLFVINIRTVFMWQVTLRIRLAALQRWRLTRIFLPFGRPHRGNPSNCFKIGVH